MPMVYLKRSQGLVLRYKVLSVCLLLAVNLLLRELCFKHGSLLEVEFMWEGVMEGALYSLLIFVEFTFEFRGCACEEGGTVEEDTNY